LNIAIETLTLAYFLIVVICYYLKLFLVNTCALTMARFGSNLLHLHNRWLSAVC